MLRKNHELGVAAHGTSQPLIRSEQRPSELLGKHYVRSVVGREVFAKVEDPAQERLVPMACEWQLDVSVNGQGGAFPLQFPAEQRAANGRGELHVTERGSIELSVGCSDDPLDWERSVGSEKVFDQR